jgi:monoamine oxidase
MSRPEVIIIGAGAAGLIAAKELCEKCNVTIIEAGSEPGGRIKSVPLQEGEGVIEAGAEFVHGDLPITKKLVKDAGLTLVKMSGKMYRKEGQEWKEQQDMIEGWDELVKVMKSVEHDMTMQELLDTHFAGERYAELRRHIKQFVQGFDVADPAKVSVESLSREWAAEEEPRRIREGYGMLVRYLVEFLSAKGCRFAMNEPVRQVDWQKNEVTVYAASGKRHNAERLLVTLPVPVMTSLDKPTSINFTPPVDDYIDAYRNIGFGTVVKVVLDFRERFWKDDLGFAFGDEMIPTWWTQTPLKNNLLTGWAGGPVAAQLAGHTDDELLEIGLASVARLFDTTVPALKNNLRTSHVFNWSASQNALGAYSYATPASKEALKILNSPLADTVFFAGEGLFEGEYPGTVEAAFKSGSDAATAMMAALRVR